MRSTTLFPPALVLLLAFPLGAAHAQYPQNGGQSSGQQGYPQQGGQQSYPQNGGQQGYPQQGGWDGPPAEFSDDLERHAFHDGIEAARADASSGTQPNPESHEEFRHPHVPFEARDTYREAYKRGYFTATRHMQEHQGNGGAQGGPPPDLRDGRGPGGWDAPPSEFTDDLQRQAFHDGIEAARMDFANHVQPSPEGHDEFRHPHVPFLGRETYREAYKRGYFMAVRHMQEQGR